MRVIAILSCFLLVGCFGPPNVDTSARRYPALLSEWKPLGLVDHFPDPLPPSASRIRFSSFPGFLQGGAWIQVRMELPEREVKNIFDDAAEHARQHHDGGNSMTLLNERPDGLCSASFHTSDSNESAFPADYRVFIFDAKPYRPGSESAWNHGTSKGIAVSLQRKEVVYWAERW